MLKALIFDVDGTLAETEEAHRRAFNDTFKQIGPDWHWTAEQYRDLLQVTGGKERMKFHQEGLPATEMRLDEETIKTVHEAKTRRYGEILEEGLLDLRPGVQAVMDRARAAGLRLAVATTTNRPNVDALCHCCWGQKATDVFDVIAAGDEVRHKKPAPDVYLKALDGLGLGPEACVAFEDSVNGLMAAKAAGLRVFGAPCWYTSGDDLSGADWLADDLSSDLIDEIFALLAA